MSKEGIFMQNSLEEAWVVMQVGRGKLGGVSVNHKSGPTSVNHVD